MSKHKAEPKPSVWELKVNRVLEDSELAAVAGGVPDREGGSCFSAHRSRLLGRFLGRLSPTTKIPFPAAAWEVRSSRAPALQSGALCGTPGPESVLHGPPLTC